MLSLLCLAQVKIGRKSVVLSSAMFVERGMHGRASFYIFFDFVIRSDQFWHQLEDLINEFVGYDDNPFQGVTKGNITRRNSNVVDGDFDVPGVWFGFCT